MIYFSLMKTPCRKRAYHPFILIAYYLNFLPQEILQDIPYSTLYDWKRKDILHLYGVQYFNDNKQLFNTLEAVANHRKLQTAVKLLLKIIAIRNFIATYQQRLKNNLSQIQKTVVSNIQKLNMLLRLSTIFKLLQFDPKTYFRWRSHTACKLSAIGACIIKHPAQLLSREVQQIKQYTAAPQYFHWSLASIYHQMKRDGFIQYHINTFYNYCRALKIQHLVPKHRRKNNQTGIRATAPLQLLHIDVTVFKCLNHTKAYIYVIKDNFSKAILHCSAHMTLKAQHTIQALQQVCQQYKTSFIALHTKLMTDNGSENLTIKNWITQHGLQFQHIFAQIDTHFSNSMVEAAHRMLKYYGLYKHNIPDFNALQKILPQLHHQQLHKPLHNLNGRTPYEVLHNIPYPAKSTNTKTITSQIRIKENKRLKCCNGYTF